MRGEGTSDGAIGEEKKKKGVHKRHPAIRKAMMTRWNAVVTMSLYERKAMKRQRSDRRPVECREETMKKRRKNRE